MLRQHANVQPNVVRSSHRPCRQQHAFRSDMLWLCHMLLLSQMSGRLSAQTLKPPHRVVTSDSDDDFKVDDDDEFEIEVNHSQPYVFCRSPANIPSKHALNNGLWILECCSGCC